MIETQGVVIRAEEGFAYVRTQRESACGGCSSKEGCGTAALSTVLGGSPTEFKVLNAIGAKPGDNVVIGLEEKVLLKSSMLAYLLPLAGLVLGISAAMAVAPGAGDLATATGAGIGLVAGFGLLGRIRARSVDYIPVILRWSGSWQPVGFINGMGRSDG